MRAMASFAMLAPLTGCAADITPNTRFFAGAGMTADFAIPVQSLDERRFAGIVRQKYDFSCGSAALATLLRHHYDDAVDEAKVFKGMWQDGDRVAIRRVGFSLLDMKRYLAARGIAADGYKVSLDQIAQTSVPGIALISVRQYKHFVVVKGVDKTEVLVGDPSLGLRPMPRAEFEAAWNGVYFVLNANQATGKASFNRPAQWAAYTRAPTGAHFHQPVSLQALALTAPFYRDF